MARTICIYIRCIYTVFLARKSRNIWSYTVYMYSFGQPYLQGNEPDGKVLTLSLVIPPVIILWVLPPVIILLPNSLVLNTHTTHTHDNTHTHVLTRTQTHKHAHSHTQTHTHRDTHRERHTHTSSGPPLPSSGRGHPPTLRTV
jgi:hypothetical protein